MDHQETSQSSEELSKDGILNLLSEEEVNEKSEEVIELEEPKKEDDEKEEEKLELKEEDEDKIEPDEEDLELVTAPARKEILGAYPDLFKKFPYLEKAFYREQKYTEMLPTIQDAQEAIDARDNFNKFQTELLNGKTDEVLKAVKETDENAFGKIVDDYLPALKRIDPSAWTHVVGNIGKQFVTSMAAEAKRTNNEDLQTAAHLVYQFLFGTSDFTPATNFAKQENKEDPEKARFEQERREFANQRFESVRDDLQTRTDNVIRATIERNIDPKGHMTDYVRRIAVRDAYDSLSKLIDGDSRYQTVKDKLWERAFKTNFSKQSVDAIGSAHKEKAKIYLRDVIRKSRTEALKGMGKRASEDRDESPLPVGRTAAPRKSSDNGNERSSRSDKNDNPSRGKKTLDYFNED